MDNDSKILTYTNIYAAQHIEEEGISDFVTEQLGTDDWISHSIDIDDIPAELFGNDSVKSKHFYSGLAMADWMSVQHGGVHINPMMTGFNVEYETWSDIVTSELDFSYTIRYLDIPYAVYERNCPLEKQVEEDTYQTSSETAQIIVENLTKEKLGALH